MGNASVREGGTVAIKPSGISYDVMRKKDIVVVDLDGYIIDGKLKPSVDLPTHLELYRNYPEIGSIIHTHSPMPPPGPKKGGRYPSMEPPMPITFWEKFLAEAALG